MPLDRADELSGGGHVANWEPGIGNYEEDMDRYGFVARNMDVVYLASEMFWTDKVFFEWYIDIADNDVWVNTDPETNTLVERIRQDESRGRNIEHIIIAREGWLYQDIDGLDGPIAADPRILYQRDVDELRDVFLEAYNRGILRHPDYKLIQMVIDPLVYFNDPEAREIIKTMDGVCYESHQYGDNWPLGVHKSNPQYIADGANWTLDQGLEFIMYYGPIRSKDCLRFGQSNYPEDEIEKKWLEAFWAHGLPKYHDNMNYYLNIFPFWCGARRSVGPEDDPDSKLGFTKWLIEQIKPSDQLAGPDDFIFSDLVFDANYYYNNNTDLQNGGFDEELLRAHWRNNGISEGRRAHPDFFAPGYLEANPHVRDEFGEDYLEAIRHYIIRPSRIFDPVIFNLDFYRNKYPDLLEAFGADNDALRNHWRNTGIEEGRQAHPGFSVQSYLNRYSDLQNVFGDNYYRALMHYLDNGIFEGRNGLPETPEACLVSPLSCFIQVNEGELRQILSAIVPSGSSVRLGPTSHTNGSWSWSGPNDFTFSAREVIINDFTEDDAGAYVVTYTNDCGAVTMRQFLLELGGEIEPGSLIYSDSETFSRWKEISTDTEGRMAFAIVPPSVSSPNHDPHSGDHFIGLHIPAFDMDAGYTQDSPHQTLVKRSPNFTLNGSGDLVAWLSGGGVGSPDLAGTSVSALPATSVDGGFRGIALRDVTTGAFVLSAVKTANGNEWEQVVLTSAQLAALPQDHVYTLDLIDAAHGGWGWVNMDSVTIPGTLSGDVIMPDMPGLAIELRGENEVRLSWPASAGEWTLQNTNDLDSAFTDAGLPVTVEDSENAAYDAIDGASRRFYRLRQAD